MKRPRWQRVAAGLALVVLLVLVAAVAWLGIPQPTLPEADRALESSASVLVEETDGRLTFRPTDGAATGLIFYPGGKVVPRAYAPAAREIAERGFLVVIPRMPLNLAVLDIGAADTIMADHPEVDSWVLGGHSLGGAMAAQYASEHGPEVEGLVLWAAYSAADLSSLRLEVAVIYGSRDNGRDGFVSEEALARLPGRPQLIEIAGGNHAGFGWYSGQPNDPEADIARTEQQRIAVEATVALLERISAGR
jgi:dienelactone hydrolase